MKFHDNFKFSRQSVELLYSVLILVIIPVMFAVNTLMFISAAKSDFDAELRRKADLASQVFGKSIVNQLDDQAQLQQTLEAVLAEREEIENLSVLVPGEDGFDVVATNNLDAIDLVNKEIQYTVAEERNQSVATLINSSAVSSGRVWNIVSPVTDSSSEFVAITSIDVSLDEADAMTSSTFTRSFIVLAVTIVIVVLLLWNHFRFVERARLVSRLKEADQLKSDFLSVATHELKAPTSVIKGYTSNIMDGMFGEVNDKMKENLQEVLNQADRLNGLVKDLLNVSRIEQGRISVEAKPINPDEVIPKIVERYKKSAADKGLEIVYSVPASPLFIFADSGRYEEIMTNLIDNAVKYSLKGTVTISHSEEGDMVKSSVRDTGIGMSAKERDRLFSRFYRVRNDKTKSIGGTGLGLWIIKQYTEKMGGKIYVDSLEGVGTEFTVELPKAKSS